MNAKRQRDKNRRRASKLAEQAWETADEGSYDLAIKIIHRAVELNPASPVLWHDQGALLQQMNKVEEAAAAFEAAIALAPDFAEAYASLAAIRARQGKPGQAVMLQREAVRHAPTSDRQQQALAAYEALLVGRRGSEVNSRSVLPGRQDESPQVLELPDQFVELRTRIDKVDWVAIDDAVTCCGWALMPKLLSAKQCQALRVMFDDDRLFSKTVVMSKTRFGKGMYRYFAAPLPQCVDAIRHGVYPHVAQIANEWRRLLGTDERYPPDWAEYQRLNAEAGQTTPSPLMLRYEAGGFNSPHQDIRGSVYFPLQLVIVLSARACSEIGGENEFAGGEFLICDQPERKESDRTAIPAGIGDAVIFCTRERLVRVHELYGLRPVKHGMNRVSAGIRYALGIPFHDFE